MSGGANTIMAFMRTYMAMPNSADIEAIGATIDGKPMLVLKISDPEASVAGAAIGLTVRDARAFAELVEGALRKFPQCHELENLILALRAGADRLEAPP